MRIQFADLPRYGLRLTLDDQARSIVSTAIDGSLRDLTGRMRAYREDDVLCVAVSGHATAERPCDRCGMPAMFEVEVDTVLRYEAVGDLDEELDLEDADLDVGFFDGESFDLDDALSEAFALVAPNRVICAGASCAEPVSTVVARQGGHPAFAALKKLI